VSNKGIFRGWDGSHLNRGSGNNNAAWGGHGLRTTRRYTNEPLIYVPIDRTTGATMPLIGASIPTTWTADQQPTATNDMSGKGGSVVGPNRQFIPSDGSVVAFSIDFSYEANAVVTSAIFFYDYDAPVINALGTIVEGAARVYGSKVSGQPGTMSFPFVRTGGKNNAQVKYAVDWVSGTSTAYVYVTGYWVRA
jgi:hypothetical protein